MIPIINNPVPKYNVHIMYVFCPGRGNRTPVQPTTLSTGYKPEEICQDDIKISFFDLYSNFYINEYLLC
jgi:hypothetical protein